MEHGCKASSHFSILTDTTGGVCWHSTNNCFSMSTSAQPVAYEARIRQRGTVCAIRLTNNGCATCVHTPRVNFQLDRCLETNRCTYNWRLLQIRHPRVPPDCAELHKLQFAETPSDLAVLLAPITSEFATFSTSR